MIKKILFSLLLLFSSSVFASLFDGKYSQAQVFDVQRNGCYSTGGSCSVSNMINPFIAPYTNWTPMSWASGDYVQFYDAGGGQIGMKQFASNGTFKQTISSAGYVQAIGSGIVYIGEPNYGGGTGYFISNSAGYAYGSSAVVTNFVAGADVTTSVLNNYSATTTPLAAGQSAPAVSSPTVTGTSTTYTTRTATSGNTTYVYRTPVTTTTYSNGTSTVTNGSEVLYQTKVSSTVTTNKISGTTLTTINTPINTITPADGSAKTVEANGNPTSTTQTVAQGLNFQVWRYDPKNYTCVFGLCAWNLTYHTPSTNRANYGNPVNTGVTANGIFIATNSDLPNNDNRLIGANDGTVMRYYGTITAPITTGHPAGSVYRLYFYNNTDDGFVLRINGGTIINQNSTEQLQSLFGYTNSGWMDVVAGQTYNIEAWYWNTWGGFGQTFYWDYGAGRVAVPNGAFTTGTITDYSVDTTGVAYSNSSVVDITGSTVSMYPSYVTIGSGTPGEMTFGSANAITNSQQTKLDTWTNKVIPDGNQIYIEQVGGSSSNTVTMTQDGNKNKITATLQGTNNTITARQGVQGAGQNEMKLNFEGNNNVVNLNQSRDTQGNALGTNGHYLDANIAGWGTTLTVQQTNNGGVGGHYNETTISGNGNNVLAKQTDNGNKILFINVNGALNTVDAQQKGTGQHRAEINLVGDRNNATLLQEGSTANNATISLTNAGGPASVIVQQNGGQSVNVTTSCATTGGCAPITVRQGY